MHSPLEVGGFYRTAEGRCAYIEAYVPKRPEALGVDTPAHFIGRVRSSPDSWQHYRVNRWHADGTTLRCACGGSDEIVGVWHDPLNLKVGHWYRTRGGGLVYIYEILKTETIEAVRAGMRFTPELGTVESMPVHGLLFMAAGELLLPKPIQDTWAMNGRYFCEEKFHGRVSPNDIIEAAPLEKLGQSTYIPEGAS